MQTIVDHPARLSVKGACAVNQMQRSLQRVDPYMPILATSSAAAGLVAYIFGAPINDLLAALLFIGIGVETFSLILPINKKILATNLDSDGVTPALNSMKRWGFLHAFRSGAGTIAFILLATAGHLTVQ